MNKAENITNPDDPETKAAKDAAAAMEQDEDTIEIDAAGSEDDEAVKEIDAGDKLKVEDQADEIDELETAYAEVADL